jgi:hypothetical protein
VRSWSFGIKEWWLESGCFGSHLCVTRLDYFLCGTYRCQLGTSGQDVKAHPKVWVVLLVACVLMQYPVIWYGAAWLRRRKLAELNEVKKILDEMDGKSVP